LENNRLKSQLLNAFVFQENKPRYDTATGLYHKTHNRPFGQDDKEELHLVITMLEDKILSITRRKM